MAVLPQQVEGIAVGADNNVYTASNENLFIIPPTCPSAPCTVTTRPITGLGANPNLLGMAFTPGTSRLVVADAGSGQVWALDTTLSPATASVVMTIPQANRATSFLNAITFENTLIGRIYVSDSGNGIIWRATLSSMGSVEATAWIGPAGDPQGLLAAPTAGVNLQPTCCGANGIAFNNGGTRMFVANTGFRNIIQIPVNTNGTAGTPSILVTGINGPDGIAVQRTGTGAGRAWVAANQSDEIVVIDTVFGTTTPGRVIDKMGDFNGLTGPLNAREPNGLLFPASVAFSDDGTTLYVSNPAFTQACPAPDCNPPVPPSIDSAWTAVVNPRSTVVKFERIIEFTPLPFP
jgi:sugar lactone lactonase YvrE